MEDIRRGGRKPGDGLAYLQGPDSPRRKHPRKSKSVSSSASQTPSTWITDADLAKHTMKKYGKDFCTKTGDTLMHLCAEASPALVFVFAKDGVDVNAQNHDGDTGLHLSVRSGNIAVAQAFLQCGADLMLKNKLGQSALHEAEGPLKDLVDSYKPGMVHAITKGEHAATQRLVRLWCNIHSKIKDGYSALELAKSKSTTDANINKCYNLLQDRRTTLELVHAVQSEDVETLQKILNSDKPWNVNIRLKDRKGKTPLACAIEQHSMNVIQMLLSTEKAEVNIRIRERDECDHTIPLYFKTLDKLCPVEIWNCMREQIDSIQDLEKDQGGNTALLRAIVEGKPADFIEAMLKTRSGYNITDRNKDGLTARELSERLGRTDIVDTIDQYILGQVNTSFLMHLPVSFYGQENMYVRNKNGKSLADLVTNNDDIQAVKKYKTVEKYAIQLFTAAATGDVQTVFEKNKANYQDKNGYTALTRAIVFNQPKAAELLITERPVLKSIGDNCNRYPLHYAYALPEEQGAVFVKMLLERNSDVIEHRSDKDGREPSEYKTLRGTREMIQMLHDARTMDAYGRRSSPLAPMPDDAVVPEHTQHES